MFRQMRPAETIDYSVMVYRGSFDMKQAAALSRAINAMQLMWKGDAKECSAAGAGGGGN